MAVLLTFSAPAPFSITVISIPSPSGGRNLTRGMPLPRLSPGFFLERGWTVLGRRIPSSVALLTALAAAFPGSSSGEGLILK
jgi:hypothetical protein